MLILCVIYTDLDWIISLGHGTPSLEIKVSTVLATTQFCRESESCNNSFLLNTDKTLKYKFLSNVVGSHHEIRIYQ